MPLEELQQAPPPVSKSKEPGIAAKNQNQKKLDSSEPRKIGKSQNKNKNKKKMNLFDNPVVKFFTNYWKMFYLSTGISIILQSVLVGLAGFWMPRFRELEVLLAWDRFLMPLWFSVTSLLLSLLYVFLFYKNFHRVNMIIMLLIIICVTSVVGFSLRWVQQSNEFDSVFDLDREYSWREENDYKISLWNECCVTVYRTGKVPLCDSLEAQNLTENEAQGFPPCIFSQQNVDSHYGDINDFTCKILEKDFRNSGNGVVGPPNENGCGSGSPRAFISDLDESLTDTVNRLGIMLLILSLLNSFFVLESGYSSMNVYKVYSKQQRIKEKRHSHHMDDYRNKIEAHKRASAISGTQPMNLSGVEDLLAEYEKKNPSQAKINQIKKNLGEDDLKFIKEVEKEREQKKLMKKKKVNQK